MLMRSTHPLFGLGLALALLLTACGDDGMGPEEESDTPQPPAPLEIVSVSPPAGATAVETGATVTVVFNQEIDPATLTLESFRLEAGGVVLLPTAVRYEAATRTARAVAPLLPGASYEAEVTTGVLTPAGSGLSAAERWSFATRPWEPVTVEATGEVGSHPSLAVDGSGRFHVSYYDRSNGDLKYGTCAANCAVGSSWQTVTVDAGGEVGAFTSLAVDGSGRLHVTNWDASNRDLRYATCAADCATAANWQAVTVDATGTVGLYSSLAVDGGGRVHVTYHDDTNGDLKYATCAADCATAANWQAVTVDATGTVGLFSSLAVDGDGRLHVSYYDDTNGELKYAACATGCATAASWQALTVDDWGAGVVGEFTSLAVDASDRPHVSYYDRSNGDLKYATCAASCSVASNWEAASVDTTGTVGFFSTSVALDGGGRVHVTYYDTSFLRGDLKYATCVTDCATAAKWRTVTADDGGVLSVGNQSSVAVDASGRVHVSYVNQTRDDLLYIGDAGP